MLTMNPNPIPRSDPGSGSPADTDVNIPSWTTLPGAANSGMSDEEDAVREGPPRKPAHSPGSQRSVTEQGSQRRTPAEGSSGPLRRRPFYPSQPSVVIHDNNRAGQGDASPTSTPTGRGLPLLWLPPSTGAPRVSFKRKTFDGSPEHPLTKRPKPVTPSLQSPSQKVAQSPSKSDPSDKPLTIPLSSLMAKLQETSHHGAASSGQLESISSHIPQASTSLSSSSRGVRSAAAPSVPTRNVRPPKPLTSIPDESDPPEWKQVSNALQVYLGAALKLKFVSLEQKASDDSVNSKPADGATADSSTAPTNSKSYTGSQAHYQAT